MACSMALMLALGSYVDLWHVGHGQAYQHNCVSSRGLWALDCVLVLARWQPSFWLPICVGVLLFLVHWHWFCVFSDGLFGLNGLLGGLLLLHLIPPPYPSI
jgi:hypothetical protein